MTAPRSYLIVRWQYGSGLKPDDYPIYEQCYANVRDAGADMWAGQIEDVAQVVAIDLDAGTARDVTSDCYAYCAERSFEAEQDPYPELAKALDARGVDYYREPSDPYWDAVDAAFDHARAVRLEAM